MNDFSALDPGGLSPSLKLCWAKSGDYAGSTPDSWLPLVGHALDAAGLMERLWDEWLNDHQRSLLAAPFVGNGGTGSGGTDPQQSARSVLVFLAAVHDCGKASVPFAAKVPALARRMRTLGGLDLPQLDQYEQSRRKPYYHGQVGEAIVGKRLRDQGVDKSLAGALASVVGAHHGSTVDPTVLRETETMSRLWGDHPDGLAKVQWESVHQEFVDFCLDLAQARCALESAAVLPLSFLTVASGLTIVADWNASNTDLFPLTDFEDVDFEYLVGVGQRRRVDLAWERLRMPVPWRVVDGGEDASLLLRRRFGFAEDVNARPVQQAAVDFARSGSGPGMLIIEDAMGAGKSEAAILAAETMAARVGASGFLFALPTQATTDAMFNRLLTYLSTVADEKVAHQAQVAHSELSTALLHGRSRLNREQMRLYRSGQNMLESAFQTIDSGGPAEGVGVDYDGAGGETVVHPWFTGRKKAVLAEFVTSTIDHLLFSALKSKHLALRHLGLTQKIIIIDEAHASSEYMNVFVEVTLEWLGYYGIGVVLLSATLNDELRGRLSVAYRRGLAASEPLRPGGNCTRPMSRAERKRLTEAEAIRHAQRQDNPEVGYPRITRVQGDGVCESTVAAALPPTTVTIKAVPGDGSAQQVANSVQSIYGGGGCILVVRNTVGSAQETYEELAGRFPGEVQLMHSRFTAADRLANDERLLERFGKPVSNAQRPEHAIVVATQVVEQSLDIDFDALLTDLAPVDILLQRIGRIHRHRGRRRPEGLADPVCHVIGMPTNEREVPAVDEGSKYVYGQWALLRAALVLRESWGEAGQLIHLPKQIGSLVEDSFSASLDVPAAWQITLEEAAAERAKNVAEMRSNAKSFLLESPPGQTATSSTLDGWLSVAVEAEEDGRRGYAKVRDGEESVEVILVEYDDGALVTLATEDNPVPVVIPTDQVPNKETTRIMLMSTVKLPPKLAHGGIIDKVIGDIEDSFYCESWQQSKDLNGRLVLALCARKGQVWRHGVTYSKEMGLQVHDRQNS